MGFIGDISVSGTVHSVAHTLFGTCSSVTTNGTSRVLNVTCSDLTNLIDGVVLNVYFKFTYNTSTNPAVITNERGDNVQLKLNGSSTTHQVVARAGTLLNSVNGIFRIVDGSIVSFVYNSSESKWFLLANNDEADVIFSGDSTGQFLSNQCPDDYGYLEIYYEGYNKTSPGSLRLIPPGPNINIHLSIIESTGTTGQFRLRLGYWSYSLKTVSGQPGYWWDVGQYSGFWVFTQTGTATFTSGNVIHVTKILGYNRFKYTEVS